MQTTQVIYADMVFLINLAINTIILYFTAILRRKKTKILRIIAGGALCALIYTIAIFTPLAHLANIFTSIVILAPGILTALAPTSKADFFLSLVAAYICTFALGGLAMVVFYALMPQEPWAWSTHSFATENFTLPNLIVAVVISFVLLKYAQRRVFAKTLSKQAFCRFKVHLFGSAVELTALIDTGNSLVDPISNKPVIIAEFSKIKPLLPEAVAQLYDCKGQGQDDLAALAAGFTAGGLGTRIRMIPYCAIGKSGVIAGFRPDKVVMHQKETKDVIIGICDFSLSEDGEYQALINPMLIQTN